MGLSASATLLEKKFGEASDNTSALGRTIADTASSMSQFSAIGASFGPLGMAIGALVGIAAPLVEQYKKVYDLQKEGESIDKKVQLSSKTLAKVKDETTNVLGDSKTAYIDLILKMKSEKFSTEALVKSKKDLTEKANSNIVAYKEMIAAQKENATILQNGKASAEEKIASEEKLQATTDIYNQSMVDQTTAANVYKTELLMAASNTQGVGKEMANLKKASVDFQNKLNQEILSMSAKGVSVAQNAKSKFDFGSQLNTLDSNKYGESVKNRMDVGKSVSDYKLEGAKYNDTVRKSKYDPNSLGDNKADVDKAVSESGQKFKESIQGAYAAIYNKEISLSNKKAEIELQVKNKTAEVELQLKNKTAELLTKTQEVFNSLPNKLKESFARDVVDVGRLQNILKGVAEAKSAGSDLEAASAMANYADEFNNAVGVLGPEAMKTLYESVGLTVQSLKELQIAVDKSKVVNVQEELKPALKAGLEKNSGKDVDGLSALEKDIKDTTATFNKEIKDLNDQIPIITGDIKAAGDALIEMRKAFGSQKWFTDLDNLAQSIKTSGANMESYKTFTTELSTLSQNTTTTLKALNAEMLKRQQEIEQNKNKTAEQLSNMQRQIDRLQTTYNK